ncbi:TniQ family protein [Neisseria chenwenguii]|uniref:TniQ family protein n=1 Tax=Neisseria chenwenguii TaxID=1853278 RepID=UPI000F4F062D|nr:TniQ family protein [Neisseria chenwenguii]ROV53847.1 hypothetical protein EGS38_11780 [Neisseria chenwenguii]
MRHLKLRTVQPFADETMSSWLIRSSLYQGCDTLTFASKIWDKQRVWTTDFERYLSFNSLQALADATGLELDSLDQMLLIHQAKLHNLAFNQNSAIWAWIICQGLRNRQKSVGQSFCPHCFAESNVYLKREWRMAWATTCPKHQILLQDKYIKCGFLFHPAKLTGFEKSMAVCHHCGHDVSENQCVAAHSEIQQVIQNGIKHGFTYLYQPIDMATWFATVKGFISLIRKAATKPESHLANMLYDLGISKSNLISPETAGVFEWLPIHERHNLMQNTSILMQHKISQLVTIAERNQVSANTIRNAMEKKVPKTLMELVNQLEVNNKLISKRSTEIKPLSEQAVMRKWARLQRKIDRIMSS